MESEELNSKFIWNFIILFSIGLILTFSFILILEILSAKKECENIGGDYKLKSFEHLCNNQSFQKYQDGSWRLEQKPINLSEILK